MVRVEPRTDVVPPTCPRCGMFASSAAVDQDNDIVTGKYICPSEHLWISHWSEVA